MPAIYLDHNATTPLLSEVAAAMAESERVAFANPNSPHEPGRCARQLLEDAREGIAAILGARLAGVRPDRLLFTSGGTESNNGALFGLTATLERETVPGTLVISAIEHPSVVGPAQQLQQRGWRVQRLRVSAQGVVEVEHFEELLALSAAGKLPSIRLASVMLGNNETGVLQPVAELAQRAAEADIPFHTDAVQVVGKLPVDFGALRATSLAATAHKFHGPRGIGLLLLKETAHWRPLLFGGVQQQGLRPGTESVALAVGFHAALSAWQRDREQRIQQLTELRDRFEQGIAQGFPAAVVNGSAAPRLPHTSNVSFVGLNRQALLMALDLAGIACSTGSACASGSSDPSPTLLAMGCSEANVAGALRFSFGVENTLAEIEEAVERILRIVRR